MVPDDKGGQFWKMLQTEDLKSPVKDAKNMRTVSRAGSPKSNED